MFGDADEASAAPVAGRLPSYIRDHRSRLRTRFRDGGAGALPDYEMLELLLFRSIPRRDVKPLAHALIGKFGDLAGVLSAPPDKLMQVDGMGDSATLDLKLVEAATHRMARGRVMQRQVVSSWEALLDYCRTVMAHRDTEQFRILFLDTRNTLIADEAQATGTIDHVPVYPREVVKRALDLNAAAIILVHNHPSGDPTPSQADIDMTRQIEQAANALRIEVHDHLIIGRSGELSFRAEGLL